MKWFELALKLLQIAPQLLALIASVETAIGDGNGALKKSLVMAPLAAAPVELHDAASKYVDDVLAAKKVAVAPIVTNVAIITART